MESGYYAALTGLVAKFDALDVAANNLANVGTTGYKAQEDFYRTYSATMGSSEVGTLNLAINNYGVLGGASTNFEEGPVENTGNPLDIALQGKGFLVVKTKAGDLYTRDGSLRVNANGSLGANANGILIDQQGDPVMGLIPKKNGKPGEGPISIPQGTVAISPTGMISVEGSVVGQLKIVDFPQATRLDLQGSNEYAAPASAAVPAADPGIKQGALEGSNVNAISETVGLILLQQQAQQLQNAISTFDKDFDQSAINNIAIVQ